MTVRRCMSQMSKSRAMDEVKNNYFPQSNVECRLVVPTEGDDCGQGGNWQGPIDVERYVWLHHFSGW